MKWAELLMKILAYTPVVVHGVEGMMAGADGQTKREKAIGILTVGAEIAAQCAPDQAPIVEAIKRAAGAVIDATVAVGNATGELQHKAPSTAPAQ